MNLKSSAAADSPEAVVQGLVEKARAAMDAFAGADQARVDEAVTAIAWSIYEPGRARQLAEIAVRDTGLGNVESKVVKNRRKTFGCLRDLMRVRTVGVIDDDEATGIVKYAKPVGVVCAVAPSTNPAATPVNKAMFAVKGGNAAIIAPSPAGLGATTLTVEFMRAELKRIGAPPDLVQVLGPPVPPIYSIYRRNLGILHHHRIPFPACIIPSSIEGDSFRGFPNGKKSESMRRTDTEVRHGQSGCVTGRF